MGNDELKKIKKLKKLLFQFKGSISILQRIHQLSVRRTEGFFAHFMS